MYTNKYRGYKLIQILPALIKDFDKATQEKDSNKTQEIFEQLFEAIQEINEAVDYGNIEFEPEGYDLVQRIIIWVKENAPFTTNEKMILREVMDFFINLALSYKSSLGIDNKNRWDGMIGKISELFKNELLIE